MKLPPRLPTAIAVAAIAISTPALHALVSLEDGKDHLYVDATVEMGYDSNLFANSNRTGSMVYQGSLSTEFVRHAGWIGVNGTISLGYARYGSLKGQNYQDPKYTVELTKQTGRTTGSLTASIQREHREDVTVNTRDVSWNYDAALNFQYPVIERYSFSGSLGYSHIDYQDKALFTNLSTYSGSLYLYYVLSEQRDFFVSYRTMYSDEATGAYDIDKDLSAGISGKIYGPFNGSVQFGYQTRKPYGTVDKGTFNDVSANGTATWNMDRRKSITASLSRSFATTATAQSVEFTKAGLLFQDSFTSRASATVSVDVGQNKFLGLEGLIRPGGPARVDSFYSLNASYFYTLNPHVKFSISYAYYQSYSNLAYAEFPRHQVNMSLLSHW